MIPHLPPITANVPPGARAYSELLDISIAADAMNLSMAAHMFSDFTVRASRAFKWRSTRNLLVVETHTDRLFRDIQNSKLPVLIFNILPDTDPERTAAVWKKDKRDFVLSVASYAFVSFYEGARDRIAARFSSDINQCPELVRFAGKVRNAISHTGRLSWDNKRVRPVSWRNFRLSEADNGWQLIGPDMNVADLVVLMLDLQEALEG